MVSPRRPFVRAAGEITVLKMVDESSPAFRGKTVFQVPHGLVEIALIEQQTHGHFPTSHRPGSREESPKRGRYESAPGS